VHNETRSNKQKNCQVGDIRDGSRRGRAVRRMGSESREWKDCVITGGEIREAKCGTKTKGWKDGPDEPTEPNKGEEPDVRD